MNYEYKNIFFLINFFKSAFFIHFKKLNKKYIQLLDYLIIN